MYVTVRLSTAMRFFSDFIFMLSLQHPAHLGVHGSFWNLETAHFGTWLILEPRRKENSPGLHAA